MMSRALHPSEYFSGSFIDDLSGDVATVTHHVSLLRRLAIVDRHAAIRIMWAPGLPKSEIACYEKHHNNNTNDGKNIHVRFSLSFA
jgi:hypothetical protein